MSVEVVAKFVNKYQFGFECPFCFSNYKKNGEPYKRAKKVIHYHGSEGTLENRTTTRIKHCDKNRVPKFDYFIIHITDETIRTA